MNESITQSRYAYLLSSALLAALPATGLASTFTVNTTTDPATPAPSNCTTEGAACSLRDALAAADLAPDHDQVVFDVDDTIYLTRSLVAQHPVTIDGGGVTTIRVHQGYNIAQLPYGESGDILPVLQPVYYSPPAGVRYLLSLYGSGSEVLNLALDGGITPPAGEGPVAAVDWDANGTIDYYLLSSGDDGETVWLLTGGIRVDFGSGLDCPDNPPLGQVRVAGNQLTHLGGSGISVYFHVLADISGNEITGGGYPQPGFNYDGINTYCGAAANVAQNFVSGYRNGIAMVYFTATSVSENQVFSNRTGIEGQAASALVGPNLIADNESAHNEQNGIQIRQVADTAILGNEVHHNGSDPQSQGGIWVVQSGANTIAGNESTENSGFGIALDSAEWNAVEANETSRNGGVGIALVNGARFNTVAANESTENQVGIISVVTEPGVPMPYDNTIVSNEVSANINTDLVDFDPVCNDTWADNEFGTAFAASGACIQ